MLKASDDSVIMFHDDLTLTGNIHQRVKMGKTTSLPARENCGSRVRGIGRGVGKERF